jgi:hypothetical protein
MNQDALITQIDYVKSFLEDKRYGEALNYLNDLSKELETTCDQIAHYLSINEVQFTKEQLKTKKGNYIQILDIWCKVINRTATEIELEITKGVSVVKTIKKSKIKINESSHA